MPRAARENTPTSVILTKEQKAFIKKIAAQENRTFSHQIRHVIVGWIEFNSRRKERTNGKEGEKAGEEGQKEQEVGA